MALCPTIINGDWDSVRKAIQLLSSNLRLGKQAVPTFGGMTLTGAITAPNFISNIAIGTSPFACTSTTLNSNLNADRLDDQHGSYYATATGYLKLDQTTPQTFTNFDGGTGLMKVTAGLLGLDTNSYYKSGDSPSFAIATLSSQLKILEGGSTPTKYSIFQGGDQTIDLTYTLPTAFPAVASYPLISSTAGVLSWNDQAVLTTSSPTFVDNTLTGLLDLPTTSSTVGQIRQNSIRVFHTYGTDNLFIGLSSGRLDTLSGTGQNVGLGSYTLNFLTTGLMNMAIGTYAGRYITSGGSNVLIGRSAGGAITEGSGNMLFGRNAGVAITTASSNVGIGNYSLGGTGNYNTAIGVSAGQYLTTGASNIFLGYNAGRRQTASSNLLIIDNRDRSLEETEITNAILYGVMAAAPADQTLRINANVGINQTPTNALSVPLDSKIDFGDNAVYIWSDDDGHLDLTADVSIDLNGLTLSQSIVPITDDTYYLGEIGTPFKAYKALILKDTTDGKHYKITVVNGVVTTTALD